MTAQVGDRVMHKALCEIGVVIAVLPWPSGDGAYYIVQLENPRRKRECTPSMIEVLPRAETGDLFADGQQ